VAFPEDDIARDKLCSLKIMKNKFPWTTLHC